MLDFGFVNVCELWVDDVNVVYFDMCEVNGGFIEIYGDLVYIFGIFVIWKCVYDNLKFGDSLIMNMEVFFFDGCDLDYL